MDGRQMLEILAGQPLIIEMDLRGHHEQVHQYQVWRVGITIVPNNELRALHIFYKYADHQL
jgi:hypothetical protein